MNTWSAPTTGLGLYYPEAFAGTIDSCFSLSWVADIHDSQRRIWKAQMPKPLETAWGLDKSKPVYFAMRERDDGNGHDDLVFKSGYMASGFKYVKLVKIKHEDMNLWSNYPGTWLDDGIQYLDTTIAQIKAHPQSPAPNPVAAATQPLPRHNAGDHSATRRRRAGRQGSIGRS